MITAILPAEDDFEAWRAQARRLARAGARPEDVIWQVGTLPTDLFASREAIPHVAERRPFGVPQAFVDLARHAICHSDPGRFALLYQLLVDLLRRHRRIDDAADPLVHKLTAMAQNVQRDIHKMRAFVRFRMVETDLGEVYVAWFEPDHHITRANAQFFIDRFAGMRWSILTPDVALHWDGKHLQEGPAALRQDAPAEDAIEGYWQTYYASIFNPARLKVRAMLSQMPRKYWRNMPETGVIPNLIKGARAREETMLQGFAAQPASEDE